MGEVEDLEGVVLEIDGVPVGTGREELLVLLHGLVRGLAVPLQQLPLALLGKLGSESDGQRVPVLDNSIDGRIQPLRVHFLLGL